MYLTFPKGREDLELKDLPTVFIYGVDHSILYIEKEIVEPVKRAITGEKVSPEIPSSNVFPDRVVQTLSTPYYELSTEEKEELNKSSWWVWLILLLIVLFIFRKSLLRLW